MGRKDTVELPWRTLMPIAGALLAIMAGVSLWIVPAGGWFIVVEAVAALGVALVVAGAGLILLQRQRTRRGLDLARGRARAYGLPAIIVLLTLALVVSFVPLPLAIAWIGNVLPLVFALGALGIGLTLMRDGVPPGYRQAQRAYDRGDLDEALVLLRELGERSLDFYGAHHLETIIHRQQGHYAAAYEACDHLIELRPDLYYGYAERGLILLEEGKPREACKVLREATEIALYLPEAHFNLGMACAEAQEHERAVASLGRALRLGLRDEVAQVMARYHLHLALEALGRQEEARTELRRLRRGSGVLRRWQRELSEDHRSAAERRREQALITAIGDAIAKRPDVAE